MSSRIFDEITVQDSQFEDIRYTFTSLAEDLMKILGKSYSGIGI
jgi:hypothetical protein